MRISDDGVNVGDNQSLSLQRSPYSFYKTIVETLYATSLHHLFGATS
ncbi:MAG TPA: hypothetical protein IGS40_20370 [Trichormus sp. M33_DOE_039]|nr:hypothetical protein [Trichormus sp. M33_DOE_039]